MQEVAALLAQLDGRMTSLAQRVHKHAVRHPLRGLQPSALAVTESPPSTTPPRSPAAAGRDTCFAFSPLSLMPAAVAPLPTMPPAILQQQQQEDEQQQQQQQQQHPPGWGATLEQPCSLATPHLNSTRLLLQQREHLLAQLQGTTTLPAGLETREAAALVGAAEARAARQRAATAATSVHPGVELHPGLPPTEAPTFPSGKAAALAHATKRRDKRWERQQQAELAPPSVWRPEQRLPQLLGAQHAPLPPPLVQPPDAREVAAALLGLRLE